MYTRRDKRERKKRKKHPHTPRACHTLLLFFFLLHRGRGRPAVKRSQVVTGRQATVIDASSPALCVRASPPVCVEQTIALSPVLCFGFSSWNPVAPRPRHCFFFHQRRDCLSVLHEQLHQKYNLTAQFTLRVFLSFARSVRGRPPVFFSSVCVCVCCVRSRSGASVDVGCLKVRVSGCRRGSFGKLVKQGAYVRFCTLPS